MRSVDSGACLGSLESDEERDDFYSGAEKDLLPELGWSFGSLVSFYWQTGFPMVWEEYLLELSHPDHGSYAVHDGDDGSAPEHQR